MYIFQCSSHPPIVFLLELVLLMNISSSDLSLTLGTALMDLNWSDWHSTPTTTIWSLTWREIKPSHLRGKCLERTVGNGEPSCFESLSPVTSGAYSVVSSFSLSMLGDKLTSSFPKLSASFCMDSAADKILSATMSGSLSATILCNSSSRDFFWRSKSSSISSLYDSLDTSNLTIRGFWVNQPLW